MLFINRTRINLYNFLYYITYIYIYITPIDFLVIRLKFIEPARIILFSKECVYTRIVCSSMFVMFIAFSINRLSFGYAKLNTLLYVLKRARSPVFIRWNIPEFFTKYRLSNRIFSRRKDL